MQPEPTIRGGDRVQQRALGYVGTVAETPEGRDYVFVQWDGWPPGNWKAEPPADLTLITQEGV